MPRLMGVPPQSPVEVVTDFLHGVPVEDPYRWLEDQDSLRTRAWITAQTCYARAYLDGIAGRERIRQSVRELLDSETYDSFVRGGSRYFFRKRIAGQEQPCIYMRDSALGEDQLLVDPVTLGGKYAAVKPLRASTDGSLLLYETKQGGERAAKFDLFDVKARRVLPDGLPHGYLRGFAFASDTRSFYFSHEPSGQNGSSSACVFHHVLGAERSQDREIFRTLAGEKLRLGIVSAPKTLGFLVYRFGEKKYTDFSIWGIGTRACPIPILRDADYLFHPRLAPGRILALTDLNAPNRRIVEVQAQNGKTPLYFDLIPEQDMPIRSWAMTANYIVVSYTQGTRTRIALFDHHGKPVMEIVPARDETVRVAGWSTEDDELIVERESFTEPVEALCHSAAERTVHIWARRTLPVDPAGYNQIQVSFASSDGTAIPMYLVGRCDVLDRGGNPTIMTSYGGFGVPMTPRFSVLASFLMERGCLFALPNIRGGSEHGVQWHEAAKRRNRQTAYDDFLSAAEWLVRSGHTGRGRLAIFGGSNSGLLVGASLTQRPDLFCAVLCIAPLLDMLRFHLFDSAHIWKDEFGTAEDAADFAALAKYSPYHHVRGGVAYPATMIISGDADQNCNALHSRKMTARLQHANSSGNPVFLDYSKFRGHSPVLPLSDRIEALTDRLAFLCDQLDLPV